MLPKHANMEIMYDCLKSVRIRSFSGPYFPPFGLNTERYSVSLRIHFKSRKIRTRKTPNTDTFYAVYLFQFKAQLNVPASCQTSCPSAINPFRNLLFSDIFRGYRKGTLAWNGLNGNQKNHWSIFVSEIFINLIFLLKQMSATQSGNKWNFSNHRPAAKINLLFDQFAFCSDTSWPAF